MRTTILLCAWLFAALSSFGANPDYRAFRGSGGILITTNPPTGLIVIDGSGVFTSSGTNATLAISTNGVLVAVASTNINFVKGTNVVLTATNIASTTHIGIHAVTPPEEKTIAIRAGGTIVSQVATQLNVVGGPNILILATNLPAGAVSLGVAVRNPMLLGGSGVEFGTWSDTAVGFSNASSGVLSLGNLDPGSGDNWTFAGNVIVLAMPGTGNGVAISAGGILGRTNFVSNITLLSLSNTLVLLSSNVAPAPPLNSVQFNFNGVQQGSADFLFANGVATVGQGVEVTTGSFVLNGGTTALVAWNGLGRIRWDADGVMRLENDAALSFNRFNLGGNDAGFPAIGRTNGDVIILGANGAFKIGGSTNKLIVPAVHIANDGASGTPLLRLDNPLSAITWDLAIDSHPETYFLGLGRVGDGTYTMVWELGGNVGIGITNPTVRLDVQGRFMARSNVYFPNISSNATPVALLATDSQGEVYEFAVPRALAETNAVLTNLVGTVANNVTNVVSLSTTNATSKPLTNSYANGVLTLFGVEGGANVTITPNGSNLVIAATAGSSSSDTNAVLTNIVGTVGRNVTNVVSLSTTNATSKPLTNAYANGVLTLFGVEAGANVTITPNGSNLVIAATAGGASTNEVLTNLVGTVARNVTNFVSLSTSNATSKPLTNSYAAGVVTVFGVEAGANITLTHNASNIVIAGASSSFAAGNSNQIPFINVAQTGYTYAGYLSQTNPGFGFSPSGPHGGYGGLMVFGNSPMGLVTIGHPNAGSDFETFATALVISNRYNGAADFKNDMVKVDAVMIGGGLRADSTMTRWRVWQGTTSSNDVAELNLNGQMKLYGGTLYRSNTVALPTAAELGAGGYWVGVSNNANANTLVSIYSVDGTTTIMKHLVP